MDRIIEVEVLVMFGERYDKNWKRTGEWDYFKVRDIDKITIFHPKANHDLPLFFTKTGLFGYPITLEALRVMLEQFGFFQLDSSNLINVNNVIDIDDRFGRVTAVFEHSEDANVSRWNKKLLADLIKKRDKEPS